MLPINIDDANEFVRKHHRHNKPVTGAKFAIAVGTPVPETPEFTVVGVVIVGRPTSPWLQTYFPRCAEITRCCTDGTRNAASMLYGAARRAARAMGHMPIYTYSLPEEGGASLRAAGFVCDKEDAGGPSRWWHNREGRKVAPVGEDLVGGKLRWLG